jgi:hypothetical protein
MKSLITVLAPLSKGYSNRFALNPKNMIVIAAQHIYDLAQMQIMSKRISLTDVFRVLADVKTQRLLNSIAIGYYPNSQILITNLGLTTRQYYDRIRRLTDAGLIRRDKGRYSLSSFGNIIIRLQKMAERTVSSYWKLEAIDRIRSSGNSNLAEVDYLKLIDILLNDH